MVPMELVGIHQVVGHSPAMVLREATGAGRLVPIMIGQAEAAAIATVLEDLVPPRPLTHDLAVTLLTVLGASLERVVITEIRDHTFYAELHLRTGQGEAVVSSRPSDAVALAVRLGTPLFATEELLDEVGEVVAEEDDSAGEDDEGVDAEAILEEFRDFLVDVDPEDFGL